MARRSQHQRKEAAPRASGRRAWRGPGSVRWARWLLGALVVGVPLIVVPTARDSFVLPKVLASEWLTLASLVALLWGWRRTTDAAAGLGSRAFARQPAVRAAVPLLLVASASLLWTSHRVVTREALVALWIGTAGLVAWSWAATDLRLRRLLDLLLVPAALMAVLGILQAHRVFQPFGLAADLTGRMEATSMAGNVGVFGAYFILPLLLLAERLLRAGEAKHRLRFAIEIALAALFLYALAVSQTLTVFVALAAGATTYLVLRIRGRARIIALAAIVSAALALALVGPRVSERLATTRTLLIDGQWNALLSFRGDGWSTAVEIWRRNPLIGTGHGTFRREFAAARLALVAEGQPVSEANFYPHFANAHNDYLEVAAELGLLGIAALAYGLWVVISSLRRAQADQPLAAGGTVAIGVLALAYFPFETPLLAYPSLLFLAWVLARRPPPAGEPAMAKA